MCSSLEVSESSLLEVAQGCPKLHTLILSYSKGVSDAGIAHLFTYCTQLTHLDLTNCEQITGKCLEDGGGGTLKRLYLDGCPRVRIAAVLILFSAHF